MSPDALTIDLDKITVLVRTASAVVDAITSDDMGQMVAGQWMGGHGGLLSRETIKASDALRNAVADVEAQLGAGEGTQ